MNHRLPATATICIAFLAPFTFADDWTRFRGKHASATSSEKNLPVQWSEKENIVWQTKLPGPGTSSPILTGGKIFLTCYTGYGTEAGNGEMDALRLHLICADRKNGKILWNKTVMPALPEQNYRGFMLHHGYASSTPVTDGKHVWFFLGKTGVLCFDLDGNEIWRQSVGTGKHGWGSATSPVLYKDLVIVNASVESRSLVALDKKTGREVWRATGISSSWSSPVLVEVPGGQTELVVSGSNKVLGYDPQTGKQLWHANSFTWYVCPTVVSHNGIIYTLQNSTCVAVKAGGRGDVTESHTVWQKKLGSVASSLVFHGGHVYWLRGGNAMCLDAATGNTVYRKSLRPGPGTVYASPIVADGKIFFVSQKNGTFVVAAGPKFEQLAHNVFADDNSRTNASPIVDGGCLLMRTDRYLYCIGKK